MTNLWTLSALKERLEPVSGQTSDFSVTDLCITHMKALTRWENNVAWAKKLEQAGCHVIYGVYGLKTHCKVLLGGAPRGRWHQTLFTPVDRQLQRLHGKGIHGYRFFHVPRKLWCRCFVAF